MLATIADWLFDTSGLTPHGFCLLWEPGLIWMHALSDLAIGCAYFSIPLALAIVARRRKDLFFRPVFWLFAAFILLCGTTHWLALATLWIPAYGLEGVVKVVTAVASVGTAIILWRLLPRALALPSPAQMREVDDALRESEARHRASFERSPVPVHTLDASGRITGVSDSWLALLGYARDEVLGRPVTLFQPDGTGAWTDGAMTALIQAGAVRDVERRFLHRDSSIVEALVSARMEETAGASWAVCVVIDITARRRAEEALRASEERLHQAQKMEAVGQLTGGIAHDFNNMLQGITGGLDLVERRLAQGQADRAADYLGVVRQSVDRAAGLTQRMLAFARRQSLRPRATEPDDLVRSLEELIRRTVGPNIALTLRLQDGKWPALCDPHQLESALINLVINARDAMPDGGAIEIATADRHLDDDELAVEADVAPGDFVEIAVTDTGTGMPEDVLARAFEPFFTTKPTGQGTGLGLSQLYGFVRQSGGLVRLESEVGRGTTVRVFLPRCAPDAGGPLPEPLAAPLAAEPGGPMRDGAVLLVDDEEVVRLQLADALRDAGLTVLEAADGPSGLRILQTAPSISLLVTDVGLPGLNGRQLAEAAQAHLPGLPVVLITGYTGGALDDMDPDSGIEVLRKPFALELLVGSVRSALRARMLDSAAAEP